MNIVNLTKTIEINASKETVWDVLLQDETYRKWTSVFAEGSYAVCDWQEGSQAYFLTPEGNGLFSKVLVHKPCEVITFEHLGLMAGGKEMPENEETKEWKGTKETYLVSENNGITTLKLEQEISESAYDWMSDAWDKAFHLVKELAESKETG